MDNNKEYIEIFFKEIVGVSNEKLISALTEISTIQSYPAKTIILHQGEKQENLPFQASEGIIRGYLTRADGKVFTDCFNIIVGFPLAPPTGLHGASPITICTETDLTAICVPISSLLKLAPRFLEVEKITLRFMAQSMRMHWDHKRVLINNDAYHRYKWFLKTYPGLIDQVSHHYIAEFLNMTPETLSRMRRRQKMENK